MVDEVLVQLSSKFSMDTYCWNYYSASGTYLPSQCSALDFKHTTNCVVSASIAKDFRGLFASIF